jgi:hypothetical protein
LQSKIVYSESLYYRSALKNKMRGRRRNDENPASLFLEWIFRVILDPETNMFLLIWQNK